MSDNDILFDDSVCDEVQKYMESQGYEGTSIGRGNHDVYKKEPVYNFELHRTLFDFYVYLKAKEQELDVAYIEKECEVLGIAGFEKQKHVEAEVCVEQIVPGPENASVLFRLLQIKIPAAVAWMVTPDFCGIVYQKPEGTDYQGNQSG